MEARARDTRPNANKRVFRRATITRATTSRSDERTKTVSKGIRVAIFGGVHTCTVAPFRIARAARVRQVRWLFHSFNASGIRLRRRCVSRSPSIYCCYYYVVFNDIHHAIIQYVYASEVSRRPLMFLEARHGTFGGYPSLRFSISPSTR